MFNIVEIKALIKKDFTLELRNLYSLNSILVYAFSSIFVSYLVFEKIIEPKTWNALFWIILLFAAVNAVSKSFLFESSKRHFYYYSIVSPASVIISKLIYNTILMLFIAFLSYGFYSLIFNNIVANSYLFIINLILGAVGLSVVLTMVAAISSRAGNNFALMSILSFPVILPLLIISIKLSSMALGVVDNAVMFKNLAALFLLIIVVVILSLILFPFLWKE